MVHLLGNSEVALSKGLSADSVAVGSSIAQGDFFGDCVDACRMTVSVPKTRSLRRITSPAGAGCGVYS